MTCAVFISYRRTDAGGHAGRLYDRLRHWFDEGVVFYDLDGIDMGDSFPAEIEAALDSAAVVLVLIGPDWLAQINGRIGQPGVDFVRREVELALARHGHGALVLPVLRGGAGMPAAHQFHTDLQTPLAPLCGLDAHSFQGKQADWDNQFVALRTHIAAAPGIPAPRFRAPAGAERPYRVIKHLLSPHFRDPNGLLADLCRQLAESGRAALLARAALYGMGGIGKTQLALKYSMDYRDLYAGVWWFRAESETTLHLDAQDCCNACGAPVQPGEAPTAALKRWLARQTTPWLLVFDNAEDVAALSPHLPEGGLHHVLITSRNPAWGAVARAMELAVWTPKQGAEFLAGRLPGAAPADLLLLAADLGGLPLALEQAASYIEQTGTPLADYRALLAGVDTEDLILDEGRIATGYERTVLATLSLAFAKLSPAASQLLRLFAYAAPEPLPERFLREAADELPAELAEATANPLPWNRMVAELRAYGLAERPHIVDLDREPGKITDRTEPALSLHRLTQQTLRAKLAQADEDCHRMLAVLRQSCPTETDLPKHWPRLAALTPHVTQLDRYHASGWLNNGQFSWLLDRVATYLKHGPALYADSAQWLRSVLAISRKDLGDEHPGTLTAMNNLAETLRVQGDLAGALELQKSVLATWRRMLGEEHPATLIAMGNLANSLYAQGDLADACELQTLVLATHSRVLGEEHPTTFKSMNNLAETLRAQGDLAGALELQKSVLAICRRVLGEEHPDTLTSTGNLANTLHAQGNLAGAFELQKSALATRRRVLGEEHPATLTSMSDLAAILHAQGDLPGALELQKSALTTLRRILGDEHPNTLSSMNNHTETMRVQGNLAGAQELQQSVLATRRRVLGEEHPDTLTSMNNLANTLHAQGDLAGALELQKLALATRRRVLGEEHPDTLTSMGNLANTFYSQGNLAGALELEKSALATLRRMLGEEHPDTLTSMNNLANTLHAQGDLAGALELRKSALATRRWVLGDEHPDTLMSMGNLASTLHAQGDLTGALELEKSALATLRRVLGEEHPHTLAAMGNLAGTLHAQGDLAGALELEKLALATRRRVLGEEHPDTLASMGNLASTLHAQGDLAGSLELEKSALATLHRVLGEEHPDTLTSMNNLALTLKALGDLAGALELEKSALATRRRVLGEEHPNTLTSMNNFAYTLWQMNEHQPAAQLMRGAAEGRARTLGPDHPDSISSRRSAEQIQAAIEQAQSK